MGAPKQARSGGSSRFYEWPPGAETPERFDSVTSVIGGGVPKPALKAWGERTVAEVAFDQIDIWRKMERDEAVDYLKRAPFRTTDKAATQGSDIHGWAEAYVLGHAPQMDTAPLPQRPYLEHFLTWLDDFKPTFEMTEGTVYNRHYGYAGTLDFIARIDRIGVVLGDYKTGKGVYGEVALQLAAYRNAEFIGLPDGSEAEMPQVDACYVLHLTPKGYRFLPVNADPEAFRYFLYAQQVRHFAEVASRQVIGEPLTARNFSVVPSGASA